MIKGKLQRSLIISLAAVIILTINPLGNAIIQPASSIITTSGTIIPPSPPSINSQSRDLMGVMTFEWQHFTEANTQLIRASGAMVVKEQIFSSWWSRDIQSWLYPNMTFQAKHQEIRQWLNNNGMKYWIDSVGWSSSPPEGWDQMEADVIMNRNGLGDQWIGNYSQIIKALQPDVVGVFNEPPLVANTQYSSTVSQTEFFQYYRQFIIKAIEAYKVIKPDLIFTVCSMPFWDLRPMAADPIPEPNVIYDVHYYYALDGNYPPQYQTDQLSYWNGHLSEAKVQLYDWLLNSIHIQTMVDKNLPVIIGETGSNNNNPNALSFMQDIFDFAKDYNMGIIQECFRAHIQGTNGNTADSYERGILNADWTTLNQLGKLWATNMGR